MRFNGRISRPFSDEKLRGMIHHLRRIMKELSLPDRTKTVNLIFGGLGLTPKLEPTRVSPEPVGWRPQISRLSPERSPSPISYSLCSWSFPFLFSSFVCVLKAASSVTCQNVRVYGYYKPYLVSGFTGLRYNKYVVADRFLHLKLGHPRCSSQLVPWCGPGRSLGDPVLN
ncbi:hypothetical protein BDV27DRAFT_103836 [Aspergillus caelatus]|uniref:Uncharacterized protein n=1 Tax=Aspergillus caelatus TaxID=61420 RepID=A0A5N7A9Z7_9EURO|nr:uncharacterized protein BDV27DRAFT_103836 [Aspergillus caelatus]KAE8365420.1 hypothetical protein BDV27DRAFT_103836 [Aspergillus caelatus]